MKLHPVHPMLVHAPLACWVFIPVCDALALTMGRDVFWQASALLSAFGAAGGALAATFGALDLPRAKERAARLSIIHASLMSVAWLLASASLFGRLAPNYAAITPAPSWAVAVCGIALLVTLAGAWCGGEMVYGRGVGVRVRER